MIPILFSKTETDFTHNGVGRLVDCISCVVTEERNGIFEVELKYPVTGRFFDRMLAGGIIGIIHDDNHDIQPFDLYRSDAPIDGVVTFYAHHISYRLNNVILEPYTAASASAAVAGITTHSVNTNSFTFSTDKSVTADFNLKHPASVRSILFGTEGSLLDTYGPADFKFDKFSVQMLADRGTDTGVTVRYGKNMVEMDRSLDESGTYNAIAPYWTDGEKIVYPTSILAYPSTTRTPVKPVEMDMSDQFESKPTKTALKNAATAYLDANEPWKTGENIRINFIALWQTEEYESIAAIQRVGLCDTVSVYWTDMGIVAQKQKVVRVVYDVLAERFNEIELGALPKEFVVTGVGQKVNTTRSTKQTFLPAEESDYEISDPLPTGVSSYTMTTYTQNGMCYLTARFQLSAALGSTGVTVVTNMPKPVAQWSCTASAQTSVAGALFRVTTTGTINIYYGASGIYNIVIAYPIAT